MFATDEVTINEEKKVHEYVHIGKRGGRYLITWEL
jgi:hypothetical protein